MDDRSRMHILLAKIRTATSEAEANKTQAELMNVALRLAQKLGDKEQRKVFDSLDKDIQRAHKQRRAR